MKINQALLDEVTRIKVNIMRRRDSQVKSIMIAAANKGEGTSTLAANLALSIGLAEKARVLLIDANLRHQSERCDELHVLDPGENKLDVLSGIPQEIKERLEKDFDWVIYDTAPVSSYPDTLLVSPLADGIVLVIMAEKTRRAAVQKVKESFESINAKILGGVLNGRRYVVPKFIYKRL